MPMSRLYETHEVRRMLQLAEGAPSPLTGIGAHSRVLHAQGIRGGMGTTPQAMMHRTHKQTGESNKQFDARGGKPLTSAFGNLLQQADAVCQALNSWVGQEALHVFDRVPNIPGGGLRATIDFGPIRSFGFLSGSGASSMVTVHKTESSVRRPADGAAGVRVILDRHNDRQLGFHIQTCMPLEALSASNYQVTNGDLVLARG